MHCKKQGLRSVSITSPLISDCKKLECGIARTFQSLPVTLRTTMFDVQIFYTLITWNLCALYASRNKQKILSYVTLKECDRVKEETNIVQTVNRKKTNWIGHILRRKCLLIHVTEGKIEGRIEVTRRRGRRLKHFMDHLKVRKDTGN
jgi:hypothetical protein